MLMRSILSVAVIVSLGAVPAVAAPGAISPTLTQDNPSSCLGAERAGRNSNSGDLELGVFGQVQSDYVASLNDRGADLHGQSLQGWLSECENAPGQEPDDSGAG